MRRVVVRARSVSGLLQRVLVLALGELAADADRRRVLQEDLDAGDRGQLRPQLLR